MVIDQEKGERWNEPEWKEFGGRQFTDRIEGQAHGALIGCAGGATGATCRSGTFGMSFFAFHEMHAMYVHS
jgi:hypothetical protein